MLLFTFILMVYADQFGGKGKKFKYKQLNEFAPIILQKICINNLNHLVLV